MAKTDGRRPTSKDSARLERFMVELMHQDFELGPPPGATTLDADAALADLDLVAEGSGALTARLSALLRLDPDARDVLLAVRQMASLEAVDDLPSEAALWLELRNASQQQSSDSPPVTLPTDGRVQADQSSTAPALPSLDHRTGRDRGWLAQRRASSDLPGKGILERLADHLPRGPVLAPAALGLALVAAVSAVGWWQSSRGLSATTAELEAVRAQVVELADSAAERDELMDMLVDVSAMDFGRSSSGTWARVIYDPAAPEAMVYAGALPEVSAGHEITTWLIREGEPPRRVRAAVHMSGREQDLWVLKTDAPMNDFDSLAITLEPDGQSLVTVDLNRPDERGG